MSRIFHLWCAVSLAFLLLVLCLFAFNREEVARASATLGNEPAIPAGGFVPDGSTVNITGQAAGSPSLAVPVGISVPWVAYVQGTRVLVAKLNAANHAWAQQDGALNRSLSRKAISPSLDFAGSVPWVAWAEESDSGHQINASWYNGSNWTPTPVLNRQAESEAGEPVLVAGATISGAEPLPWVAWSEMSGGVAQIAVSRASSNSGDQWLPVGDPFVFAAGRNAASPDLAFAGAGNPIPWVVWQEKGAGSPGRIYVRRFVSDTWQTVGRQENCGNSDTACALNLDPQRAASAPHIVAGSLTTDSVPIPWVVFAEETAGASAIRVLKLDIGIAADASDDRFIPVGNNINSQCLGRAGQSGQGGSDPDIFFVGHVIHVAWVEQQNGVGKLFVCHLADARPGQERWDLDSDYPINRQVGAPASSASLSSNGDTPYLAWQEGSAASNVYVAHRYPAEPAWGRNYPPFIRTISWSREVLVTDLNVTGAIDQAIREMVTKEFVLTTSCYHAEGWEHIQEIQFKIANDELTAFLGKYVAAEDKLYVANADGEFTAPGFTPGSGQQYVTDNVILNTAKTLPRSHGDHSPVLDIDWVMSFRTPTKNQDLLQQINIVYDDGRETGFFQTGLLSFDYRVYMPNVAN